MGGTLTAVRSSDGISILIRRPRPSNQTCRIPVALSRVRSFRLRFRSPTKSTRRCYRRTHNTPTQSQFNSSPEPVTGAFAFLSLSLSADARQVSTTSLLLQGTAQLHCRAHNHKPKETELHSRIKRKGKEHSDGTRIWLFEYLK